MELRSVDGRALTLDASAVAVCVPVPAADDATLAGIRHIAEHTPAPATLVLAAVREQAEVVRRELASMSLSSAVALLELQERSAVGLCAAALAATAPADAVLIAAGLETSPGWLERLREAATSDSTVASATPLSIGAAAVELFAGELAPELPFLDAARRVEQGSLRLRPKIAAIGPGCCYLRRRALMLAGPLADDAPLTEVLLRLGVRLNSLGMVNVLADDVLVAGGEGFGLDDASASARERLIDATLADDAQAALRRSLDWTRAQLRGLSVTIDGRSLDAAAGGTQTYIVELILALAREPGVALRVLVPDQLSERAELALSGVPGIERLTYGQALERLPLTDVVHRPQQVFTAGDLELLRLLGKRVVVGQQDMIAYHNPSYHADIEAWRTYRRATRLALAGSDQVVFFSEHAKRDALAEDLLPNARAHVAGLGAETLQAEAGGARPPAVRDGPFLLCLGADYAHKNRPFAIELAGALHDLGWEGTIVLAGPHVPYGSSREDELALLRRRPELAELTVDLGLVGEVERRWLFANASALVYPTMYEGFGLLPLEAAHAGLPCLFAAQASLAELAGAAATLSPWDAELSARAALPLLSEGGARERHLQQLQSLFPSWREVLRRLLSIYGTALSEPVAEAAPRVWQELDRERYIVDLHEDVQKLKALAEEYQVAYNSLESRTALGLPLIDEGGLLSAEAQRGLMRIASRRVGAIVLRPLALLGRLAHKD